MAPNIFSRRLTIDYLAEGAIAADCEDAIDGAEAKDCEKILDVASSL